MFDLSAISNAPALQGLTSADLEKLSAVTSERAVARGDRLFGRGENADTFYIVKAGTIALTIPLRVGGEDIDTAIEEKSAGEALGWSALVEPYDSIYSAHCSADGSVIVLPRSAFLKLTAADPGLGYRFMTRLTALIGGRARVLQSLWVEEVEQSMSRVRYWRGKQIGR